MPSNALPIPNNNAIPIDKATVSHYMKSKLVTRYFHGNTWFINYDELEKVLLKKVRINSKLKTK